MPLWRAAVKRSICPRYAGMSTAMSSSRWRMSLDGASPGHGTVSHSLLARKVGLLWTSAAVT